MAAVRHARPLVCIFVGPSLPAADLRAIFETVDADLRLLPPAQQGGLLQLLTEQPDVVGIVDGFFFQVPSILHREVLLALERGIRVLGASSLGALRAAELDVFGMEGVGQIYGWYRSGEIDGDDEVAVAHADASEGYRPLTVPLVNLRYGLQRAQAQGIVSERVAAIVLGVARRIHFSDRTFAPIFSAAQVRAAASASDLQALHCFLRHPDNDLKRADAVLLARTVARRIAGHEAWPATPDVRANQTGHFDRFQREYVGWPVAGHHVLESQVLTFHRVLSPSYPALHRCVLLRCLAVEEAARRGLVSQADDLLLARFRTDRALAADQEYTQWLRQRYLAPADLLASLRALDLEAQLAKLYRAIDPALAQPAAFARQLRTDLAARLGVPETALSRRPMMRPGVPWDPPFLRELKLRGRFGAALRLAGRIVAANAEIEATRPDLGAQVDQATLETWLAATWNVEASGLAGALQDRGVGYTARFLAAARQIYRYQQLIG